ncbi:MAG: divalent-cation tolerance protein CutA [Acidimicrobiia bacterium]|nr:divalent-cation tolerance protein CutA [Acidimicrobiia bacterium]
MATNRTVVMTTCASENEARQIAGALVERRVAACVQALPITSTFVWNDAVQEESEILVLAKTTDDLVPAVEATIEELHSYDLPEVIALPISGGSQAYLAWIGDVTS